MTDDTGAYRFDAVPAGSAELTFRLLNFSVLRRSVSVANGASVNADVVLTLSLSADVIVTGAGTFRNVADVEDPAANLVGIAAAARPPSPRRSSTSVRSCAPAKSSRQYRASS